MEAIFLISYLLSALDFDVSLLFEVSFSLELFVMFPWDKFSEPVTFDLSNVKSKKIDVHFESILII